MIKQIIWDFNGTILDDLGLCHEIIKGMLEKRGLPAISLQRYQDEFDFPVADYYRLVGFDFIQEPFAALAAEYIGLYQSASFACPLREGIYPVLEYLRRQGIRQILLSATEQDFLIRQVGHYDLAPFFDLVLGLEDHFGRSKLDLAVRWFGQQAVAREQTVIIGDTVHDRLVAQSLSCPVILLAGGHNSRRRLVETGCPVLDRPADLPAVLFGPDLVATTGVLPAARK